MVTIDLQRTPQYEQAKAKVDESLRLSVDLAEEAIVADPSGTYKRRVRLDGVTVDFSTPGVLIGFRRTGEHSMLFVELQMIL